MPDDVPLRCAGHAGNSPAGRVFSNQKLRVYKSPYGIPLPIDGLEKMDYPLGVLGTEKIEDITLSGFDIISPLVLNSSFLLIIEVLLNHHPRLPRLHQKHKNRLSRTLNSEPYFLRAKGIRTKAPMIIRPQA